MNAAGRGWGAVAVRIVLFTLLIPCPVRAQLDGFGLVGSISDPKTLCAYERLGLSWARAIFRWAEIEPTPGVFDWTAPDAVVKAARAMGYRLMVTLEDTPTWANGGKPPNFPPDDPAPWVRFVRAVIKRYDNFEGSGYRISHWAMWNEPNLPIFFRGNEQDYLHKIFLPGAQVVHELQPGEGQVLGPEFAQHWVLNTQAWDLGRFLDQAGDQLDILSLHVWNDSPGGFEGYLDYIVKPVLEAHGWLGRPFWVTETGYPTCGTRCENDAQAHYLLRVIEARQRRAAWFQRVFFFSLFFDIPCSTLVNPEFTCENWSVRPAYQALVDFLENRPFSDPAPECHVKDICNPGMPAPFPLELLPTTTPKFGTCYHPG